jgi:hypothetical protein
MKDEQILRIAVASALRLTPIGAIALRTARAVHATVLDLNGGMT